MVTRHLELKIQEKRFSRDRLTDKPDPVVPAVSRGKGGAKGKGGNGDCNQRVAKGQYENETRKRPEKGKSVRHHLFVESPTMQMANERERALHDRQENHLVASSNHGI